MKVMKGDGKIKKETKKQVSAPKLARSINNPIISPRGENAWENRQTLNPGAILLSGKIHLLYRAMGDDWLSRLGYASSKDGVTIDERSSYPVYEHKIARPGFSFYSCSSGGSFGGIEDPRLIRVENEDTIYMIYTACDGGLRVGLTSIKVDDFLQKKWDWKSSKIISKPGEVHKNWVIFPEKIKGKYAILHSISPEILVDYVDDLDFKDGAYIESLCGDRLYMEGAKRTNCWDNWVRGAGAPPIKTRLGWLILYQAMEEKHPDKFKVGAMILDLKDPTKILYRAKEPILEPNEIYENNGFKSGVVYVTGAIVKDDELLIYYGASDSYVAFAKANLEEFLKALSRETKAKPKLKKEDKKTKTKKKGKVK